MRLGRLEVASGVYDAETAAAVRAFQAERGLRVDGCCGSQTWEALVEAGHRLGDRLLYRAAPMPRGDDVGTLQAQLAALGFDPGKPDGIFGPLTADALVDFQRNAGLRPDGVCGPVTVAALRRLGGRDGGIPVTGVREREFFRIGPRTLLGRRVVVAEAGGLGALAAAVVRDLSAAGADVLVVDDPNESAQAAQANRLAAAVVVGLVATLDRERPGAAFFARGGHESATGRRLATLLGVAVGAAMGTGADAPAGMGVPLLRETRMPAAVCHLAPVRTVVERSAAVASAIAGALDAWVGDPLD